MVQRNITVDEQKSEAIQPLETLFNFNFTVFVWLPIFQPLGPKGGGHGPNGPMVNTLVAANIIIIIHKNKQESKYSIKMSNRLHQLSKNIMPRQKQSR